MSTTSPPPRGISRDALTGTPATVSIMAVIGTIALAALIPLFASTLSLGVAVGTGCMLAGTTTAATYNNPLGRALAGSGAALSGLGLLGTIVLPFVFAPFSIQTGLYGVILLCACLSVFGILSTATGSFGNSTLLGAIPIFIVTGVSIVVGGLGLHLRAAPATLTRAVPVEGIQQGVVVVQRALFTPTDPIIGVATLGLLWVGWLLTLSLVVSRLPLSELAAQSNQQLVRQLRMRIAQFTRYTIALTVVLTPSIILLSTTPIPSPVSLDLTGAVMPLAEFLTARHTIRSLLTDSSILLWGMAILSGLPRVTRLSAGQIARWLPVVCSGLGALLAVSAIYPLLYRRIVTPLVQSGAVDPVAGLVVDSAGQPGGVILGFLRPRGGLLTPPHTTAAAVALLGLLCVVTLLFLLLSTFAGIGLLPRRVAPGALAAGSLFIAGTCAGLVGGSPLRVVIVVGCAILLWDIAEYGTTLYTELGSNASTRGLVATHTLSSFAVAGIGVIIALVVDWGILAAVTISSQLPILIMLVIALIGSAALLSTNDF